MAKAPKCKVCGASHWASEPHTFALGNVRTPPVRDSETAEIAGRRVAEAAASKMVMALGLEDYLKAERAKKAAYMREYRAGVRRRTSGAKK